MMIKNTIIRDDWLSNFAEYKKVEDNIYQLFKQAIADLNLSPQDWIFPLNNPQFFPNEPDLNGNPIFWAENKEKGYLIRIIMHDENAPIMQFDKDFDGLLLYTLCLNIKDFNEIYSFFLKTLNNNTN